MDQEKFDQHLMDYLFDELDEVTHAAMKRKIESDAECRELVAGLRATIEVAQLPLEEPDVDLEERILAAADLAQHGEPWHKKALRSLSWAGSWAMRPQLAMAALLMLVIGSSVLLMRARPGSVAVTPSKEDAPSVAADPEEAEPVPAEAAADDGADQLAQTDDAEETDEPSPSAASAEASAEPQTVASYDEAMAMYRSSEFGRAQVAFNQIASSGGANAPSAALFEAKSVRAQSGCSGAVSYYHEVRANHGGTAAADDATYELAECLTQLGKVDEAKKYYALLADNDAYKERVAHELSKGKTGTSGGSAVASKRRAAAKPKMAPAAPAKPPAGTTGGKAAPAEADSYESDLGL